MASDDRQPAHSLTAPPGFPDDDDKREADQERRLQALETQVQELQRELATTNQNLQTVGESQPNPNLMFAQFMELLGMTLVNVTRSAQQRSASERAVRYEVVELPWQDRTPESLMLMSFKGEPLLMKTHEGMPTRVDHPVPQDVLKAFLEERQAKDGDYFTVAINQVDG